MCFRLRNILEAILQEEQSGFRPGRSCTDDVFFLKELINRRREFNLETHLAFVDYTKAFDKVNRDILWLILRKRGIPNHLINAIKSLYINTKIILNLRNSLSKQIIHVNQGVRQGCSL